MEVALRGGALADVGDGDGVLAPELGGPGEAGSHGDLGADDGGLGDDAELLVAPVGGHLPAAAVGVGRFGEHVEHEFVDGHAEGEHDADVAVVGQHPVLAGGEGGGGTDLGGLLALAGDDKGGAALAVEGEPALRDASREQHQVPHLDEGLVGEAEVGVGLAGATSAPLAGGGRLPQWQSHARRAGVAGVPGGGGSLAGALAGGRWLRGLRGGRRLLRCRLPGRGLVAGRLLRAGRRGRLVRERPL